MRSCSYSVLLYTCLISNKYKAKVYECCSLTSKISVIKSGPSISKKLFSAFSFFGFPAEVQKQY